MRAERFAHLKRVVLRVMDLPQEKRKAYLDKACKNDPELRREVESLLAHGDEPDEMLKTGGVVPPHVPGPLADIHDKALPRAAMAGRYRNLRRCGEGGMGVVYVAEDTKLQRTVALKFLRPVFVDGDGATARFIHEARIAASLDHPNICTIYEIEEVEGQAFISMAYVEGVTLQERIAAGPLLVDDTVDIGLQIANGLREAHEKGIVHRDIKPSNLMLSSSGFVKVMDFGIAWFGQRPGITGMGVPVGTVGYMSPEQTRGERVDYRTDIWALGVVLYEMLAGELPFRGGPDLVPGKGRGIGRARREVPPALDALIQRCLEQDPAHRPDTVDVVRVLEALRRSSGTSEGAGVPAGRRRGVRALGTAGLVLLVVLAAAGVWRTRRQGAGTPPSEPPVRRLTAFHQEQLYMGGSALSPDGRYVAVPHHGVLDVVSVETGEQSRIDPAYPGRIVQVLWAADGNTLLCSNGGRVWFQDVIGGSSRVVLDGHANQLALSPDGTRIAFFGNAHTVISVMDASGGGSRSIQRATSGELFFGLTWSPNGSRLAYLRAVSDIDGVRVESLESCDLEGRRVAVIEGECCLDNGDVWGSLCWLPDGRLVFGRFTDRPRHTSELQAIKVDASTGLPDGEPERFLALEGVMVRHPSASADGHRLSFHRQQGVEELLSLQLDETGETVGVERLSSQRWPATVGTWTRDGQGVFFAVENFDGDTDISIRNLETGVERPFVQTSQTEEPVCLTPDGSELIFRQGDVFRRVSVDGGPDVEIVRGASEDRVMCAAAPESLCVLCSTDRTVERTEVVFRRLAIATGEIGDTIGRVVVDTEPPLGFECDLSPDGTRIAIAERSGRLRILDLRDGSERELGNGLNLLQFVAWSDDARWLCVSGMHGEAVYWIKRVPLDGSAPRLLWRSDDAWVRSPRPSPDGSRVAFTKVGWQTDVWLAEDP